MKVKALLLDFDGTLVSKDMLVEVIDLVGKKAEADRRARDFQSGKNRGLEGLIARINLLKGLSVSAITDKVNEDLALIDGAEELIDYCRANNIVVIIATGSIKPILDPYKDRLGIEYIVCSEPVIKDGVIQGISEQNYPQDSRHFKVVGISKILDRLGIKNEETVAIGDGRGDIPMFELAGYTIAINPKGGIEKYANDVVTDLHQAKEIIATKLA